MGGFLNAKKDNDDFFSAVIKYDEDPQLMIKFACAELVKVNDDLYDVYGLVSEYKGLFVGGKDKEKIGELPKPLPLRLKLTTATPFEKLLIAKLSVGEGRPVTGTLETSKAYVYLSAMQANPDSAGALTGLLALECVFSPCDAPELATMKKGKPSTKGSGSWGGGANAKAYSEIVQERLTEITKLTGADISKATTDKEKVVAIAIQLSTDNEGLEYNGALILETLRMILG